MCKKANHFIVQHFYYDYNYYSYNKNAVRNEKRIVQEESNYLFPPFHPVDGAGHFVLGLEAIFGAA